MLPIRRACRTTQTFYSCLFICYQTLTNLNDAWVANICPKYTFSFSCSIFAMLCAIVSLELQTIHQPQVHVKSWYVFTEDKMLRGGERKEWKICFLNRKISWLMVTKVLNSLSIMICLPGAEIFLFIAEWEIISTVTSTFILHASMRK